MFPFLGPVTVSSSRGQSTNRSFLSSDHLSQNNPDVALNLTHQMEASMCELVAFIRESDVRQATRLEWEIVANVVDRIIFAIYMITVVFIAYYLVRFIFCYLQTREYLLGYIQLRLTTCCDYY